LASSGPRRGGFLSCTDGSPPPALQPCLRCLHTPTHCTAGPAPSPFPLCALLLRRFPPTFPPAIYPPPPSTRQDREARKAETRRRRAAFRALLERSSYVKFDTAWRKAQDRLAGEAASYCSPLCAPPLSFVPPVPWAAAAALHRFPPCWQLPCRQFLVAALPSWRSTLPRLMLRCLMHRTATYRRCCAAGEEEFEALDKLDRLEVFEEYIRCGTLPPQAVQPQRSHVTATSPPPPASRAVHGGRGLACAPVQPFSCWLLSSPARPGAANLCPPAAPLVSPRCPHCTAPVPPPPPPNTHTQSSCRELERKEREEREKEKEERRRRERHNRESFRELLAKHRREGVINALTRWKVGRPRPLAAWPFPVHLVFPGVPEGCHACGFVCFFHPLFSPSGEGLAGAEVACSGLPQPRAVSAACRLSGCVAPSLTLIHLPALPNPSAPHVHAPPISTHSHPRSHTHTPNSSTPPPPHTHTHTHTPPPPPPPPHPPPPPPHPSRRSTCRL
jgi:hypothetical protein